MTDDEIRAAILNYFRTDFQNFRGDNLFEGPCNCDEDDYDRAIQLLNGAELTIRWPSLAQAAEQEWLSWSREFRPGIDEPPY